MNSEASVKRKKISRLSSLINMNSRKTAFRDVWNLINFKAFQMARSISKRL